MRQRGEPNFAVNGPHLSHEHVEQLNQTKPNQRQADWVGVELTLIQPQSITSLKYKALDNNNIIIFAYLWVCLLSHDVITTC